MKKYKARTGAKFTNNEAQIIGSTINTLRDTDGHITPVQIVDSAKSRDSPLHEFFEWSNRKAGKEFRLQQARDLISHIVEIVVVEGEKVEQRSFFAVSIPRQGNVYVTIEDAVGTEDYRKQLLTKAIATLQNLTVTLKMLKEHDYPK